MRHRYIWYVGLLALVVLALSGWGTAVAAPNAPLSNDLRISQVYGGGGNAGATYTHDFIEIFNSSSSAVSLNGLSLQYASATGTGNFGANTSQLTELPDVQLQPGQYYLVQQATGGANGAALPAADVVDATPINLSGASGKVVLVTGITSLGCNGGSTPCDAAQVARIIDLVGYGTANYYEGVGAAPTLSNTTAALRSGDGCTDTDDNAADFAAGTPLPRNTSSPTNSCGGSDVPPTVSSTNPGAGATAVLLNATITINFSEAVDATTSAFILECPTGSPVSFSSSPVLPGSGSSFVLTPDSGLPANTTCAVTVTATEISDQDGAPDQMAADYAFSFTTLDPANFCAAADTLIHVIQGSGAASAENGNVHTVQGIVVGDFQDSDINGFFVQEEDADADADPLTSEGIFVYEGSSSVDVAMGDEVQVTGTVDEYYTLTELTTVTDVRVCSSGNVTPTAGILTLPLTAADDLERYEGMRVMTNQAWTVTNNYFLGRGGALTLSYGDRLAQPTQVAAPGAAAIALQTSNNLNQIVLDEGSLTQNPDPIVYPTPGGLSASNTVRGGDQVSDVVGVLTYGYYGWSGSLDAYRIHPTQDPTFSSANPRPATSPAVGGTLKVTTFNVLNYFNTFTGCTAGVGGVATDCRGAEDSTEFARQRDKIISAIVAVDADVVGLMEIENDGYGGSSAIADLVNGLNVVAGAGTYAYVDVDTRTGTTNILGTDAIKVGLLYKPGTVSLVGNTAVLNTAIDPAFLDAKNRPTLIQSFQETASGETFTVAVNHFKSKGSACDDVSDPDTGDGQGNCNLTREAAAQALVNYLATDPTGVNDADFLIIGDLNSYAMEDPIVAIEGASYTNLAKRFGETYGYSFDGQWGTLDYALASSSLTPQVMGAQAWHINADEPIVLDYNTNFKSVGQITSLYNADAYRASDHDPVVVGLNLAPYSFSVVINEVDYDQPGTDTAEFIELKNVSATAVDLGEYTVELVNGNGNAVYDTIALPAVSLPAGGYYVLCANSAAITNCDLPDAFASIQNGAPDGLALRQNGALVDALAYEGDMPGTTETSPAVADPAVIGQGLSRYPDGADTNDNSADFSVRCITPGIANSSQTSSCTVEFVQTCTLSAGTPLSVGTTNPITLEFVDLGIPAVTCVRVMYFGYHHPNASTPLQTGAYWHIESDPPDAGITTAFTYSLTLPFTNPQYPNDKICRWLEGAGPGYGWDCAAGGVGDYTATSLTRPGLHGFSDWAVGSDVGPTAVSLHTLSVQTGTLAMAWPVLLLALATGLAWWRFSVRKQA